MKNLKPLMNSGYEGIIQAIELAESMGIPTQDLPWTLDAVNKYVDEEGQRLFPDGGWGQHYDTLLEPTGWSIEEWKAELRKREEENDRMWAEKYGQTNEQRLRQYIRQVLLEADEIDAQIPIGAAASWSEDASKDVDWPAGKAAGVLFFDDNDSEYKLGGQTHGALSHAIKHFKDTFSTVPNIKSKMENLALKFEIEVWDHFDEGGAVWFSNGGAPEEIEDRKSLEETLGKNLINLFRNTVDRINDKVEAGEKLFPIEEALISLFKPWVDAYQSRASGTVRKADQCKDKGKKTVCMRRNKVSVLYDDSIVSTWGIVNKKKKPKASLYPKADPKQQEKIIDKVLGT